MHMQHLSSLVPHSMQCLWPLTMTLHLALTLALHLALVMALHLTSCYGTASGLLAYRMASPLLIWQIDVDTGQ